MPMLCRQLNVYVSCSMYSVVPDVPMTERELRKGQ